VNFRVRPVGPGRAVVGYCHKMSSAVRFLVVGTAWRAGFFLRLGDQLEEVDVAGVVVHRSFTTEQAEGIWHVPGYSSLRDAVREQGPDFVVVSVPRAVAPELTTAVVRHGVPVLLETPPATTLDGMRRLWDDVGMSGLVQVAEQYPLYPGHAARLALVKKGVVGQPTSVQVSSTHGYHAVALIRKFLNAGFAPASVKASSFKSPLVNPSDRSGATGDGTVHQAETVIATLDFGPAMGLYDFTTNQWHNKLRARRIVVRGSHGEIVDDTVSRMADERTFVSSPLIRRQLGYDLDLDGYDTDHISFNGEIIYRNPYRGLRLADDEIAVASLLSAMAKWCRQDGPPPYPLAQGSQDHLVSLAIDASLASGGAVTTTTEKWAL
jgi:predicted dehydrogenase